ncbi:MAG: thiosulfate oxidation carrier complex protein SoxZ [Ideonella sp.]|jgi:sulfur-oxidizing protein SoxZ|nr:thiosulfate oxidation carrier complex protein SoxZ [Ideonella sp.]MBL0150691.1 thiosulfate oxidation carrier complex protein SoxZ [Ideonella sp.]
MARTLIHIPPNPKRGQIIDIQVTIAHPMETGFRSNDLGQPMPRDILTRFECRFDGRPVFGAELHPAIAANPYLAFAWRVEGSGTLSFTWEGDNGFRQTETVVLQAT